MNKRKENTATVLGYMLISFALVIIGFFTFGFELSETQQENLLYNFILFIVLTIGLVSIPFLNPMSSQATKLYRAQGWSVIFIAWFTTLELFYIGAWVKDLALVWQPDCMSQIIQWMQSHINVPPLNEDRKLFMLTLDDNNMDFLSSNFNNEQEFLDSAFGHSVVFLHFLRAMAFLPLLATSMIFWWRFIGGNVEATKNNQFTVKGFLWFAFISFFMILIMMPGAYMALFMSVGYRAEAVVSKLGWLIGVWLNIGFFFIVIGLRLIFVWLTLGKKLVLKIFNFIGFIKSK